MFGRSAGQETNLFSRKHESLGRHKQTPVYRRCGSLLLYNFKAPPLFVFADVIDFDYMVMDDAAALATRPEDGVYCRGLFLEGARWDSTGHVLGESLPKQLQTPAPVIWMIPREIAKMTSFPHYECPIYKTSDRRGILSTTGHSTNYVMEVRLPSDRPQAHWIKRGVALLTQLDD